MTLQQAYRIVNNKIPVSDIKVQQRLDRAYNIICYNGEGYQIKRMDEGEYEIHKASTSLLEDTSIYYEVTTMTCTCPDYDKARGNLCKHRLAVMMLVEMEKG
jgi:regulatory protein YycI of two-component signal transduction system YycFG